MMEMGRNFWNMAVSMTMAAQKMHSVPSIIAPYASNPLELSVVISSADQEDTIIDTLDTVVEAMEVVRKTYEILVFDDHSMDRTAELVRTYIEQHPDLNIVLCINKVSKGTVQNYLDGAFIGCGEYYRMVYGDNSESVETMADVFKAVGEADIIIPYYISMHKKGLWKSFTSGSYTWCINMLSGNRISHYDAAPIHLRYNVMRWHSAACGTAFQIDLVCRLLQLGFTYKQVPCRDVPYRPSDGRMAGLKHGASVAHVLFGLMGRKIAGSR
jgi:hypothetical protein